MIPDESILEKSEEMVALAEKFGANNIRFFGEVVGGDPRPGCGVDIIVDVERGEVSVEDIDILKSKFKKLLGREVGLRTPDMFLPPIYRIISDEEVVHLDVLLNRSTDHLKETPIDPIVIEKRLELLAIAKRYGLVNLRLAGEIVRKSHQPDCTIQVLADIERSRFVDQLRIYGLELRMGKILGRMVTILIPDMMVPPLTRECLREAIVL